MILSRKKYKVFGAFLLLLLGAMMCGSGMLAWADEYATGNASPNTYNDETGNGYYDCYSITRCPRWIKVSRSVYDAILDESRVVGKYQGLRDICKNDEYIVIAGNQRYDGSLQIYNLYQTYIKKNGEYKLTTLKPTKNSRTYISVANKLDGSDIVHRNFFGEIADAKHNRTWDDILYAVLEQYGGDVNDIAAFCPSMVDDVEYYAVSNVSNGSGNDSTKLVGVEAADGVSAAVAKKTIERKVIVGSGAVPMIFSHNIYASAKDTDNTWWRIERSFYVDGEQRNGDFYGFITETNEMFSLSPVQFTSGPVEEYNKSLYKPSNLGGYNDEGKASFLSRDIYSLAFTDDAVGKKYKYCETLYMGNNNGLSEQMEMTMVCAEYQVESIDDCESSDSCTPPSPPNEVSICDSWWQGQQTNEALSLGGIYSGGGGTKYDAVREYENKNYAYTRTLSGVSKDEKEWKEKNWKISNGINESAFNNNSVYVKPQDTTYWQHCYYPGVQVKSGVEVTAVHGEHEAENTSNRVAALSEVNDDWTNDAWCGKKGGASGWKKKEWQNQFNVSSRNFDAGSTIYRTERFAVGNTNVQSSVNEYKIPTGYNSRAGMSLSESMASGTPSAIKDIDKSVHSWERPVCDNKGENCKNESFSHGSGVETIEYGVIDEPYVDTAMVKVPYNFKIDSVLLRLGQHGNVNGEAVVFAGESVEVTMSSVSVGTRENSVTGGTYATKVDQADIHMITYVTGEDNTDKGAGLINSKDDLCGSAVVGGGVEWCEEDGKDGETLNYPENTKGSTDENVFYNSINVSDAEAGKWFCAALAVFPAEVSGNIDVKDANGNTPWKNDNTGYNWRVSPAVCRRIAKRPSVQVWGGSLYSEDRIVLPIANKKLLTEYVCGENGLCEYAYDYKMTSTGATAFSSWVEHGVAANRLIGGLASGAATGYYNVNNGERTPHPGVGGSYNSSGNTIIKSCILAPLTMPNDRCDRLSSVGFGGYGTESFGHDDREALVSVFRNNGTSVSNKFNYEKIESSGDVSLKGFLNEKGIVSGTIPKSNEQNKAQTWILEVTGSDGKYKTLTIDEDVKYEDGGYTALSEIPKLIIYAGNIDILCGVTRVDAVLITAEGGKIDTCSDAEEGNWNVGERSNQLKINGTIITDKLIAGRTYGAGTGSASAVPAEIIDYDTSLYLWAMQNAKGSNSGKMDVVYLTELAPRY